jgi:hypothetical protein
MFRDAIEGEPSHLEETTPTFSPSIPILDVSSEPIFQPILDPDDPFYAPKSHDDPRNSLRQPNHRSHEDYQEEQRLWQECLEYAKSTYAIVKEWMDKDEALLLASKLKTNPRETNPWEILDNKTSNEYRRHGMMETNLLPIDIHKETPLEFEEEDDINEHESYFMSTPLNPCSREKTPNSIGPSNYTTQEIFNPSFSLFIKILKGWL